MRDPAQIVRAVFSVVALVVAMPCHAAVDTTFGLRAAAKDPREIRKSLESFFLLSDQKRAESEVAFVKDRAAHQRWMDLEYDIVRAIEEGVPLGDLSKFGLIPGSDGSYSVDLKQFPQWAPLQARTHILSAPEVIDAYEPRLKARGFRDADIEAIRKYVASHDLRLAVQAAGRPITDRYARYLQDERRAGRALGRNDMLGYHYQVRKNWRDVQLEWTLGLLGALDNQRQRILASFLEEQRSMTRFGGPDRTSNEMLQAEAELFISGKYLEMDALASAQMQQEAQERRKKLLKEEAR